MTNYYMWLLWFFPLILFEVIFSSALNSFLSHVYTGQYSAEDSGNPSQIFREFICVLSLSLSLNSLPFHCSALPTLAPLAFLVSELHVLTSGRLPDCLGLSCATAWKYGGQWVVGRLQGSPCLSALPQWSLSCIVDNV